MKVVFIVPSYNIAGNIDTLIKSLLVQTNPNWECTIIDDISSDETWGRLNQKLGNNDRFILIKNKEKKYALRNIVEVARQYENQDDVIVAVVDGDDSLCNEETVNILIDSYQKGNEVVWTAHRWDTNGMNISGPIPSNINPYQWPWKSSHLRTFRSSLLKQISDINFKNFKSQWFKRGYDQALMLPLLHVSNKFEFIPKICYLYNLDSSSIPIEERNWCEREQISTINFVRARGFIT